MRYFKASTVCRSKNFNLAKASKNINFPILI